MKGTIQAWKSQNELIIGTGLEKTEIFSNNASIYLKAEGRMFDPAGTPLGHYVGLMIPPGPIGLKQLTKPPPHPPGPITQLGPVPPIPLLGKNKVEFHFDDKNSLTVVGQGSAQLIPGADGGYQLMITAMNLIVGGTGRYQHARGVQAAVGVTFISSMAELGPSSVLHTTANFSIQLDSNPIDRLEHQRNRPPNIRIQQKPKSFLVPSNSSANESASQRAFQNLPLANHHSSLRPPLIPNANTSAFSTPADSPKNPREANIRLVLKGIEQLNSRDFKNYMTHYSPHYLLLTDSYPAAQGPIAAMLFLENWPRVFPGVRMEVEDIFANESGTIVMHRSLVTARATNGFMGLPKIDRPISFRVSATYHFKGFTHMGGWLAMDNGQILRQSGIASTLLDGLCRLKRSSLDRKDIGQIPLIPPPKIQAVADFVDLDLEEDKPSQKNSRTVMRIVDHFNARHLGSFSRHCTSDFSLRSDFFAEPQNRHDTLSFLRRAPYILKGLLIAIETISASPSGDTVGAFCWCRAGGLSFSDSPESDGPIAFHLAAIFTFQGERIQQLWIICDRAYILQQAGLLPRTFKKA